MIKKIIFASACVIMAAASSAQKTDGTTRSLVNAEKLFAEALAKDGEKKAYLQYSADNALVFRPNPVNAKSYYSTQTKDNPLTWKPVLAKVSRSGDWGFTTGPYTVDGETKGYGQYLSLWTAKTGKWELLLDLATTHNKPLKQPTETFAEPVGKYTPKLYAAKDLAVGLEIIMDTERTLNTTLKSYGAAAMSGFLNPDARLLFPGYEPMIGKENILAFNNQMIDKISLKTTAASKAISGELAFTYGTATIDYKAELRETFNYVFIWERQADHNWNMIVQMFVPAER